MGTRTGFDYKRVIGFSPTASVTTSSAKPRIVFPKNTPFQSHGRVDPVVPQGHVIANYAIDLHDYRNRKAVPPNLQVYPLSCPDDIAPIKGEIAMMFPLRDRNFANSGVKSFTKVTTAAGGLTERQLRDMQVAGQLLTAAQSGDLSTIQLELGDDQAAVLIWGPVTICNTGPDPIPAGSAIYIDDPDCGLDANGELTPNYTDTVQHPRTKFIWTTRPWRYSSLYIVFVNLTHRVCRAFRKLDPVLDAASQYNELKKRTEKFSEIGSYCLSPTSKNRCPLRRYWLYLCHKLTGHTNEDDQSYYWHQDHEDETTVDFARAYAGARVCGTMSRIPESLQEQTKGLSGSTIINHTALKPITDLKTADLAQLTHEHTLTFRFFAEYVSGFKKRFLGTATTDIGRGKYGQVLLGAKNF